MARKIAVITSSRAEYGILYWLLRRLKADKAFNLQLVVTGAHLLKEFGFTFKEIENDGFKITAKVSILQSGDSPIAMAKSVGVGIIKFLKVISNLKPDVILVLGDRFEIFAVVFASRLMNIPIVHISGGDTTLGAIDNEFRHSISLMSQLHFVKNHNHKKKLINLGIEKENIFVVGYLGLENLVHLERFSRNVIDKKINTSLKYPFALVTFHPVTNPKQPYDNDISNLLRTLLKIKDLFYIFTSANEDSGGRFINRAIESFCFDFPERGIFIKNLGREMYLNLISRCKVMIGNSSSGILESVFFNVPVVNIEPRQLGRERNKNIISCQNTEKDLFRAINKAIPNDFISKVSNRKIRNKFKVIPPKNISKEVIKIIKSELF